MFRGGAWGYKEYIKGELALPVDNMDFRKKTLSIISYLEMVYDGSNKIEIHDSTFSISMSVGNIFIITSIRKDVLLEAILVILLTNLTQLVEMSAPTFSKFREAARLWE